MKKIVFALMLFVLCSCSKSVTSPVEPLSLDPPLSLSIVLIAETTTAYTFRVSWSESENALVYRLECEKTGVWTLIHAGSELEWQWSVNKINFNNGMYTKLRVRSENGSVVSDWKVRSL